jgi:hypothetical protein
VIGFKAFKESQKAEVQKLRALVTQEIRSIQGKSLDLIGVLLTGSVARGDARIGEYGVLIDLTLVLENLGSIDLVGIFGGDTEPHIPYHVVMRDEKIGLQIETVELKDLIQIRDQPEPEIYARWESEILLDPLGILNQWKNTSFRISDQQKKSRAEGYFYRYAYLIDPYRWEKWINRKAFTQIAQIFNEAVECYCSFLFCLNGSFVPRKDWLTYLSYELNRRPKDHEEFLSLAYSVILNEAASEQRYQSFLSMKGWMEKECQNL